MLQTAIALSVVLGFAMTELFGLMTGGLVSAGYLAFFTDTPWRIVSTMLMALVIFFAVRGLERVVILYGRRRFMATVLLSIVGAWFMKNHAYFTAGLAEDARLIGYMIPGLIANDMLKQGAVKTLVACLLLTLLIRLLLSLGVLA